MKQIWVKRLIWKVWNTDYNDDSEWQTAHLHFYHSEGAKAYIDLKGLNVVPRQRPE